MNTNRFTPVPFHQVSNFAPLFGNNDPNNKKSLEDLLFATLSNEALKQAVKTLNWKLQSIRILCTNDIRCFFFFDGVSHVRSILLTSANEPFNSAHTAKIGQAWSHYYNHFEQGNQPIGPFEGDASNNEDIEAYMAKWKYRKFEIPSLTIRKFLYHFMDMLHVQSIDLEISSMRFDINSLKEMLSGIIVNYLGVDSDRVIIDEYYHSVLRAFVPASKLKVASYGIAKEVPNDVLVSSFDKLVIHSKLPWTFNKLLLINSKIISLRFLKPQDQMLNRFIKLWQKGSHSALEVLEIEIPGCYGNWDVTTVMKGIDYQEYSGNHRPRAALDEPQHLLDIRSSCGEKATIQICENYYTRFAMYVNNPTYTDERGVEHEYLENGRLPL